MKYLILLFASLLLASCSDEHIINPVLLPIEEATIGVKSKIYYPSIESNQILSIEDFEYSSNGLLQKKIYYGNNRGMISHYEVFNYNNDGRLTNKLNYYNNINSPTGFLLIDSTVYLYFGNFLTTEKIFVPSTGFFDRISYEYNGKYLIEKSKYYNEVFDSYIIYEYKNGILNKEINYYKDNSITEFKEFKYKGAALVEITFYTLNNQAKRRINYSYNVNGKIILEKVDELFIYSSSLPYVVKYKY